MSKQSHTLNTAQIFDVGAFSLICFDRVIFILTVSYKDKLQTHYEFGYFLNNLVQMIKTLQSPFKFLIKNSLKHRQK